jgi:hypothetical protein
VPNQADASPGDITGQADVSVEVCTKSSRCITRRHNGPSRRVCRGLCQIKPMHPPGDITGQADMSVEAYIKSNRSVHRETQRVSISQANALAENYDRLSEHVYRETSWTNPTYPSRHTSGQANLLSGKQPAMPGQLNVFVAICWLNRQHMSASTIPTPHLYYQGKTNHCTGDYLRHTILGTCRPKNLTFCWE